MSLVTDSEVGEFFVIWTVDNYSYGFQKEDEPLVSPRFKFNLSDNNEWCLNIYPRGYKTEKTIIVIVLVLYSNGPFPINLIKYVSIRDISGTFININDKTPTTTFEKQCAMPIGCFSPRKRFKRGYGTVLENNKLTIRCRFQQDHYEPELPMSGFCCAKTVINVKRTAFVWTLENFKELRFGKKTIKFQSASFQTLSFTVSVFFSSGYSRDKKILVKIKQKEPNRKSFCTCRISLLDRNKRTDQSIYDDHWFDDGQQAFSWFFPFIPLKKLLDQEDVFLVNGTLSLQCDFNVSFGEERSEIERTEYGLTEERYRTLCDKTMITTPPGSLKDNLHCFYNEGRLSDLTIQTASSREFPVHKALLCARSEVFSAMFKHDTIESQTDLIDIEDLDDDTVSKMLLFIYTGTVEALTWDVAKDLYFAADKYGIVALKRECSAFLKDKMDCSNVCEVLVVADMHQDADLKSFAQDYIMENGAEIINSECWQNFREERADLAYETLQVLFMTTLDN